MKIGELKYRLTTADEERNRLYLLSNWRQYYDYLLLFPQFKCRYTRSLGNFLPKLETRHYRYSQEIGETQCMVFNTEKFDPWAEPNLAQPIRRSVSL